MNAAPIDVRGSVRPFGGSGSWAGSEVAGAGAEGESILRPAPTRECPFCDHRASEQALKEHIAFLHRERIAAMAAYQKALEAGAALEEARARYNAVLYAAVEGGPGRYRRQEHAHG